MSARDIQQKTNKTKKYVKGKGWVEVTEKSPVAATQRLKDKTFSSGRSSTGSTKNYGELGYGGAQNYSNSTIKNNLLNTKTPTRKKASTNTAVGVALQKKYDLEYQLETLQNAYLEKRNDYRNNKNDTGYKQIEKRISETQEKLNSANRQVKDLTNETQSQSRVYLSSSEKEKFKDNVLQNAETAYRNAENNYNSSVTSLNNFYNSVNLNNYKFNNEQELNNAVANGKSQNKLRKISGISELLGDNSDDILNYFDTLYAVDYNKAEQGVKLLQDALNTENQYKNAYDNLNKAQITSSSRIAENIKKEIDNINQSDIESRLPSSKIFNGNKTTTENVDNRKSTLARLQKAYNQYNLQSVADENISLNIYDMQSDKNASEAIKKGKEKDTLFSNPFYTQGDVDFIKSIDNNLTEEQTHELAEKLNVGKLGVFNLWEDDTLKAAWTYMDDSQKDIYYYTLETKGEQAAKNYVRALYNNGISYDIQKDFRDVYDDNGFLEYGQSFTAGLERGVTGFADAFTAIASDEVKAESLAQKMYQINTDQGDIAKDILYNVGNMIPQITVSIATMGAGAPAVAASIAASATVGASTFGSSYMDARRQGYDKGQAVAYGAVTGLSEAALQYALNGIGVIAGGATIESLSNAAKNAIGRVAKDAVAGRILQTIVVQSIDASGEFTEEFLQGILDPIFRNTLLNENNDISFEDAVYQGLLGALTAGVMNTANIAVDQIARTYTFTQNGKNYTGDIQSLANKLTEYAPTLNVQKTAAQINQKLVNGQEITSYEIGAALDDAAQAQYVNSEILNFIDGEIVWNDMSDMTRGTIVNPENAEYFSDRFGLPINSNMSPIEIKDAVKAFAGFESYETVITDNKTKQFYNNVEKVTKRKVLISDLPNDINGYVNRNNIIINSKIANTENGAAFVIAHELTHTTELSQSYKQLLNYTKQYYGDNFTSEVNNKIEQYEQNGINLTQENAENEVVADFVAGVLFKEPKAIQDFILSKRNFALKLYTWLKNKLSDTSQKSPENSVISKAVKSFERAFNESRILTENKTTTTTQTAIEPKYSVNKNTENNTNENNIENNVQENNTSENIRNLIEVSNKKLTSKEKTRQKTKQKQRFRKLKDSFVRRIVDSGGSINALGKEVKDSSLYNSYDMARGATKSAQFDLGYADYAKTYQADYIGKNVGESFKNIMQPINDADTQTPGYKQDFFTYLALCNHLDRIKNNKYVFENLSKKQASYMAGQLSQKYPEFKEHAKKIYKYLDNLLQYRYDMGLISKDFLDYMRKNNPRYVPLFRDVDADISVDNTNDVADVSQTVGRAKGGNIPILPIDDSIIKQTFSVKREGLKNFLVNELSKYANSGNIYVTGVKKVGNAITTETESYFEQEKSNIDKYSTVEGYKQSAQANRLAGTVNFYKNGELYSLKASDGIIDGINQLNNNQTYAIDTALQKVNSIYKAGITGFNPLFIGRNFFNDIMDSLFYTQNLSKFLKNYGKAWREIKNNGQYWQRYQALGGFSSSKLDYQKGTYSISDAPAAKLKRWTLGNFERANMFVEQAPRLAEFMTTIELAGETIDTASYDTLMDARHHAADITVDFNKSGDITRIANRTLVPFLAPSIQGTEKIVRAFKETKGVKPWLNLATRFALLGFLPSLFNTLLYGDEDWYKELSDYKKDAGFLFKLDNGTVLTFPRGRIMSVFGGLSRRVLDTIRGEHPDWFSYIDLVTQNAAPVNPLKQNLLSPIINAAQNKTWYGSDIDNESDLTKKGKYRYDTDTSWVARYIANAFEGLDLSAKRIDEVLYQYLGVFADFALPILSDKGGDPLQPVIDAFSFDPVYSTNTGNVFKEAVKELEYIVSDEQSENVLLGVNTDVPSVTELTLQYMNSIQGVVSGLWREISDINNNNNLSSEEKTKQEKILREAINTEYNIATGSYEKLQKAIEKYYDVDASASENMQKKQAQVAYTKAYNEVFGSIEAIKSCFGEDEYKSAEELNRNGSSFAAYYKYLEARQEYRANNENATETDDKKVLLDLDLSEKDYELIYAEKFEDENTKERNSIVYAVNNGANAKDFIETSYNLSRISKENGDTEEQLKWFNENIKGEKNISALYSRFFENENTKAENTINYAVSQDVRASAFVSRKLQQYNEQSDISDEVTTDLYYENGKIVVDENGVPVSGSKKQKACENLLSGDYTENEIKYFYQREYSSDDKFVAAMISGITAKEYVKFQRDTILFKSDKDTNGKTISGSLKKKYVEYLNSSNLTYTQKLMFMLMKNYKLSENEYRNVINHVLSLKISADEKTAIFNELNIYVSNGKVYARKAS